MADDKGFYGVTCKGCGARIKVADDPSGKNRVKFKGAGELPLNCLSCLHQGSYQASDVKHFGSEK